MAHSCIFFKTYCEGIQMTQLAILHTNNKAELTKTAEYPSICPQKPPILPQNGPFLNICKTLSCRYSNDTARHPVHEEQGRIDQSGLASLHFAPQIPHFAPKWSIFKLL